MNAADNQRWLRTSLVTIVLIHFFVLLWHGTAHIEIPVPLNTSETITHLNSASFTTAKCADLGN